MAEETVRKGGADRVSKSRHEVDEADLVTSLEPSDGSIPSEGLPSKLGGLLGEASEADLLESVRFIDDAEGEGELSNQLSVDVPEADLLEQHQLPSDSYGEDEDRRGEADWPRA